eukprot:Clim_evm62s119 gene=Clim_evmTU62s119
MWRNLIAPSARSNFLRPTVRAQSKRWGSSVDKPAEGKLLPNGSEAPNGFLFGEPPGPRKWETWEYIWYVGFYGSIVYGIIAYNFRPDTSLKAWAHEEAMRRIEEEDRKMGISS